MGFFVCFVARAGGFRTGSEKRGGQGGGGLSLHSCCASDEAGGDGKRFHLVYGWRFGKRLIVGKIWVVDVDLGFERNIYLCGEFAANER